MKTTINNIAIFSLLFLISLIALSCQQSAMVSKPFNKNIINYHDFLVSTESIGLNTITKGTIFVERSGDKPSKYHVQIAAWLEIDPRDWGGITYYIPRGWEVTGINSDYPQGKQNPEVYTTIWFNQDMIEEFPTFIEIGRTKARPVVDQGGKGSMVIDLDYTAPEPDPPENFEIIIGAGYEGEFTVNPINEKITIPLNSVP